MIISRNEFAELVSKGSVPSDAALRKDVSPAVSIVSDRVLRFVASTNDVDRDGDRINQNGWQLGEFRANPVILLNHDAKSYPVGRALDIDVVNGRLVMTVEFLPGDVPVAGPIAEAVYRMCRDGYMHATSVTFRPTDASVADDPSRGNSQRPGLDFSAATLLEVSIVTVPSNPYALIIRDEPAAITPPETVSLSNTQAVSKAKRDRAMTIAQLAK